MIERLNGRWDNVPELCRTLYFFGTAILVAGVAAFEATAPIAGVMFVFATLWGITRF